MLTAADPHHIRTDQQSVYPAPSDEFYLITETITNKTNLDWTLTDSALANDDGQWDERPDTVLTTGKSERSARMPQSGDRGYP